MSYCLLPFLFAADGTHGEACAVRGDSRDDRHFALGSLSFRGKGGKKVEFATREWWRTLGIVIFTYRNCLNLRTDVSNTGS